MTASRAPSYVMEVVRAVIALVALACAQLGPLVHALTVEHATCAEHGELIEIDGGAERATARAASPGPAVAADGEGGAHGHDHCLLATHTSQAADATLSSWTGNAQLETRSLAPAVFVHRPFPILTLAPKQSPPLA